MLFRPCSTSFCKVRANQTVQKIVDELVALGTSDEGGAGGAGGGGRGAAAPKAVGGNGESVII